MQGMKVEATEKTQGKGLALLLLFGALDADVRFVDEGRECCCRRGLGRLLWPRRSARWMGLGCVCWEEACDDIVVNMYRSLRVGKEQHGKLVCQLPCSL